MDKNENDKSFSLFFKKSVKNGKVVENTLKINGKDIKNVADIEKLSLTDDQKKYLKEIDILKEGKEKKAEETISKIEKTAKEKDFTKNNEVSDKIKEAILSQKNNTTITDNTKKVILINNINLKDKKQIVYKYFGEDRSKIYYDSLFDPNVDYDENFVILPLKSVILGKYPDKENAIKGKTAIKYCIKLNGEKETEKKSEFREWLEQRFDEFDGESKEVEPALRKRFLDEVEALGLDWLKEQYNGSDFSFKEYIKIAFVTFGVFNYYKEALNSVIFLTNSNYFFNYKILDIIPVKGNTLEYIIRTEEGDLKVNVFNKDMIFDPTGRYLKGCNIIFVRRFVNLEEAYSKKFFKMAQEKLG